MNDLPKKYVLSLSERHAGRIFLAIGLSLLAHAIALFVPSIKLPPRETQLPPLIARLEPLPGIAARTAPSPASIKQKKPAKKEKSKPQPAPLQPEPVVPETVAEPDVQPDEEIRAEEPQIAPEAQLADEPALKTGDEVMGEAVPAHPLPKRAQLTFIAYKGADFEIGEARHRLEVNDDSSYTLSVDMHTTGLAGIFKPFESNQQSSGVVARQGLRPGKYSETKKTAKGKETVEAEFAWERQTLVFSSGNATPLPDQTQDSISFLYQFPQLPLGESVISIYISNGKKLERYEFTVGEGEEIQTRLGKLRTLPLRKIHARGEEGLDIWLGTEYRMLPVKIRQIDRTGQTAGEMVISEIRVADE
ncbi:MAG: DUF3108 domain-containing protein [Gallionella sp.]|nr:MAG: DUF3108 domain-containing protein [Gallionella sp.]